MATAIGLKMAWFQDSKSLQHYDLIESKRKAAIRLGAVEHGRSEMVAFIREQRRTI